MKTRRVQIDPVAALTLGYLLLVERSVWALLSIGAAALHELGHLAVARLLHVRTLNLTLGGFGARIGLGDALLSYRDEALIAAAGPAVNLLTVILLLPALRRWPSADRLLFFAAASLSLALINLLPLHSFDGGRILGALCALTLGATAAGQILRLTTAACTMILWSTAVTLWLRMGGNLSLLVLSTALLWRVVRDNLNG